MNREDVKKLLEDAREVHPFGWQLRSVGVFSYNGKLEGYIHWKGQGENSIVYNEEYDDICDLTDYADVDEYDLEVAVDLAMMRIEDLEIKCGENF